MRIAVDIDSTLHHYWDQLRAVAKKRFGVDLPYDLQTIWEIDALRPEQVRAVVAETHRDEAILAATPYPGAVETLQAWHHAGHQIHVMSERRGDAFDATKRWLDDAGFAYDRLDCAPDKVSRAAELGIELLVDDSPDNLMRALDAGIRAATLAHPWNRDVCEEEDVVCAPDWPALGRALEPLLGGGA